MLRVKLCPIWICACLLLVPSTISGADQQPADQPRTVVVNVVAYGTSSAGNSVGTCKPVRVTAERSPDDRVRVGFFESEVGGTGSQWRSAGWMAAVTAAVLTDFDPRTMRVSFEYEGRVDGPSAGALMTAGLLAAVRGDSVRPDVAMTGTINPDGSIGPVGGISHKIEGAAAEGMKLVLIPAGIRFDEDGNTGEQIDLVEYGQKLGVEVRNVLDIYQAYKLLTGVELSRPAPASTPHVGLAAQQRIREKIDSWYKHYEHALQAFTKMKGSAQLSQEIIDLYQRGIDLIKQSDQLLSEGEFTAALWDRVMAAACGYLALETGRCRYTYATRGYAGLVARLRDNDWLEVEVKKMSQRLRSETPQTLDQLSVYLIACDAFLESVSLQLLAKATLADIPDQESEAALEQAGDAAENQILAWLDLKLTGDYLDLAEGYEGMAIPLSAPWRQTGDYLRRSSSANLAVFDSLIIEPTAKNLSVSAEQVRGTLMQKDKAYAILHAANEYVFPRLGDYFGDGDPLGFAYLATSMYTHTRAAGLLAKYYSLGAELDDNAQVASLARERTLAEWLTFAEEQSRRNIALLQDSGVDATPCAQMFAIARIKARRDLPQKLEGLVEFWSADLHARVLRLISGLAQNQPAQPAGN